MKDYKLVTKVDGVKGHLLLKVPSVKERLSLMKEAGITGKEDVGLDMVILMFDKLAEFVKEVKIKKGDIVCETIDDLGYYDFGMAVMNECSSILFNGIPTGKN